MTKTIKELLDEQIEDFKTDFPAMEGYLDTEVREGMIRMLKDSQLEVISQVEALVRNEVLDEVEKELTTPTKMLDTGLETNKITYEGIKHRINNLRPIKEIEEKV